MKFFVASLFLFLAAVLQGALARPSVGPDVFECGRVAAVLGECYTYLRGIDTKPLPSCCDGAEMLVKMASKPEDKLLGCRCLKEATSYFNNIKESAMLDLSKECHVELTIFSGDDCK